MAGVDDIEREETPEQTLDRLLREGASITDIDKENILLGRWKNRNRNTTPQTNQTPTGNVSTLANSDSTNTNTGNNISGTDNAPSPQRPADPAPEQTNYLIYDIWLKKGVSPYEDLAPHKTKFFYANKGALIASLPKEEQIDENAVRHRYRFCRCEGDPDNVAEIRANARMGWAPRGGSDRARVIRDSGYYVKFPEQADTSNPNSSYAPDYTEPMWILNQNDEVQYIGDDKCPEGKRRYTPDNVALGKETNITEPPKPEEPKEISNTITYQKVEIQPIELKNADAFINRTDTRKIQSIKYPPIIIDSITVPSGSQDTIVLPDLEIIKEPFVVKGQKLDGDPPREVVDDVRIEPMKFIGEYIKIKDNLPITFRSVTMPAVIIDSLDAPKPIPENAVLPPIVASEDVIYLPEKEYDFADFQPSEIESSGSNADVKGETVILKNIELKVPVKDRASGLKFWKVMVDKPEIKIEDDKNEQLLVKIPNIMIPLSPKPTQTFEKLITSKLTLNHELIKYAPDDPQPTAEVKDKYTIFTQTGKTVPPVGDVYFNEDDGTTIYYGVNEPFRDRATVPNVFEYCKCSGDSGETSYQRGNARLGILQAGSVNRKYFKRSERDRIAGSIGTYIGDDSCPEGETKVTSAQNPDDNSVTLIPDKEELFKVSDIVLDLKDIVTKNIEKFNSLPNETISKLPKITIQEIEIPVMLENGGTTKKGTETILVPLEKLEQKEVVSESNIIVQENPPAPNEQITNPPPQKQNITGGKGKGGNNGKGANAGKSKEKKQEAKKKGGTDKSQRTLEDESKSAWYKTDAMIDDATEQTFQASKGRSIPDAPGNPMPKTFVGKGVLQGVGHSRSWHGVNTFADWEWLWPISSTYKPGQPEGRAEFWTAGESRPSETAGNFWDYLSNWDLGTMEPSYSWNGGGTSEFYNSVGKKIMNDTQFAPFSYSFYKQQVGKSMKLTDKDVAGNPKLGKVGDYVYPPLNFTFLIWKENGKWKLGRSGTGKYRYPYMIAGRSLIRQYIPRAFNVDWNTLLKNFRLSKKQFPDYVDPNARSTNNNNMGSNKKIPEYGPPLSIDYKPSLLDVGIIMNFYQSGYVNRYKLPNGNFPPLASSGTEQHLMMVDTVTPQWVQGNIQTDRMIGTFNGGKRINLNWAHEPHWCGISTDFFLRKGGFNSQGTTSVKSNESALINNGFPLNRPRLEDTIDEPWDPKKWESLGGVGTTIRDVYKRAYKKHGREHFEHPITPEYLNWAKNQENSGNHGISSIWFIEGIHMVKESKTSQGSLTKLGYDLLRKVLNPDIIDWPAATISHTGHVESVACIDINGDVMRLGGNTSTDGQRGNSNNTMGLFMTHMADFSGYPPSADRGGFVVFGRPDGYKNEHVRKARVKPGIASPWIITPVIQTYFDFVELNPDPDFPVYNTYWQRINHINTVFQSNLL